jgi:hypothetical protein
MVGIQGGDALFLVKTNFQSRGFDYYGIRVIFCGWGGAYRVKGGSVLNDC